MSGKSEDGKTGIFGQELPGTGGDVLPTDMDTDVEGHLTHGAHGPGGKAIPDEEPTDGEDVEGHLTHGAHGPGGKAIPDPQGGDLGDADEQDVEGHLAHGAHGGGKALPDDPDDVEAHLFHTGPTTEGEFSRRGPGENPHGDR
jgi:hypothetical protein